MDVVSGCVIRVDRMGRQTVLSLTHWEHGLVSNEMLLAFCCDKLYPYSVTISQVIGDKLINVISVVEAVYWAWNPESLAWNRKPHSGLFFYSKPWITGTSCHTGLSKLSWRGGSGDAGMWGHILSGDKKV